MIPQLRFFFLGFLLIGLTACTARLSERKLLIIGDSNGAREGWVYQLQRIRKGGPLTNTARSGNTIGFTDQGDRSRNTLENLTAYLRTGYAEMGGIDEILICLGTNDCKPRFAEQHDRILENLTELLQRSRVFFASRGQEVPRFVLITPPPADDSRLPQFAGAEGCLQTFTTDLRELAAAEGICLVDIRQQPGAELLAFSTDGIHFNAEGYTRWAKAIVAACY